MNRIFYVIIPAVLMAAFLVLYISEERTLERQRVEQQAADAAKAKADAEHLAQLRAKSEAEAKAAEAKREADNRAAIEKQKADYEAAKQKLKDETDGYIAAQNKSKAQIADLQGQIDKLRSEKEEMSRRSIALDQGIVAALIERQNAETEVMRYAAMVAQRASSSPLTRPPAGAPAPAQ